MTDLEGAHMSKERRCRKCGGSQTIGDRICPECGGTGEGDGTPASGDNTLTDDDISRSKAVWTGRRRVVGCQDAGCPAAGNYTPASEPPKRIRCPGCGLTYANRQVLDIHRVHCDGRNRASEPEEWAWVDWEPSASEPTEDATTPSVCDLCGSTDPKVRNIAPIPTMPGRTAPCSALFHSPGLLARFREDATTDADRNEPAPGDFVTRAEAERIRDDAVRETRELVDRQAEDGGLWFAAATAPEAYLQQELRKLHAVIEAAAIRATKGEG